MAIVLSNKLRTATLMSFANTPTAPPMAAKLQATRAPLDRKAIPIVTLTTGIPALVPEILGDCVMDPIPLQRMCASAPR